MVEGVGAQGEEAAAGDGALGDMVSSALDPSWGEKQNPLASSHTRPCSSSPNSGDVQ